MEGEPSYLLVQWASGSSPKAKQAVCGCLTGWLRRLSNKRRKKQDTAEGCSALVELEQCWLLLAHPGEGTFLFAYPLHGSQHRLPQGALNLPGAAAVSLAGQPCHHRGSCS